jgi:hypothetical protein
VPTLTSKQVVRALDHLRSDYPDPMSSAEQDDYEDVLSHLRPGELLRALEALPLDHRPTAETLLQTVMESRPGHRLGKPDPAFVKEIINQARRELERIPDAV